MNWLVIADNWGRYFEVVPVPEWDVMSEDEQGDFLNDNSDGLGMLCAGVYEAETAEAATDAAIENADEWIGGCPA
jgi:hypothetical protein